MTVMNEKKNLFFIDTHKKSHENQLNEPTAQVPEGLYEKHAGIFMFSVFAECFFMLLSLM